VPSPLLLAVDGNSLLHRAHHAMEHSALRDAAGRPIWALKGLISFVATAAARLTPDAIVIGFDSPDDSVRKADYPNYKAHRSEKPAELRAQLDDAPALLTDAGITVVVPAGYEADDVLATSAALARSQGWRTAVVTSDRDSFALIDESTSVLRVLNGGIDGSPLLTPEKLTSVCGVNARQYRDYAALRGDSSDNLPGALGIGAKTAAKLLSVFGGVDDAYAAIDSGREDDVVAVIGRAATLKLATAEARMNVARNQRLMAMREDLAVPALASMRIPLDVSVLQAALAARDIRLGPSLWALTGAQPPAWYGGSLVGQDTLDDGEALGDSEAFGVVPTLRGRQTLGARQSGVRQSWDNRRQITGASRWPAVTMPKPISKAARRAAALAEAGQLNLF
jgi:DNA polymerase-1